MARVNQRLAETNRLVEVRTRELEQVNQQLQLANQVLHQLSTHDGLTGVANRRQFDEVLLIEWRRAARINGPISLIMVDIDHFKLFNDEYGHQAGDDTLKEVAYALQDSVQRAGDLIARYGGEEFAIILPGTQPEEAARLAEAIREAVEGRKIRHALSIAFRYVTVSVGVASVYAVRDGSPAELVAAADRALYAAKRGGRNRVAIGTAYGLDSSGHSEGEGAS
jgi:diguanylate cyclase (GGDEF)-like protein